MKACLLCMSVLIIYNSFHPVFDIMNLLSSLNIDKNI